VPSAELKAVLDNLYESLRAGGVLFTSNPRGRAEGWNGERYGHYMELDVSTRYLQESGFHILNHYYRPQGLPVEQQPWLAIVSQR